MDMLPVEILEEIFKNLRYRDLKQASAVCRFWYEIYKRPTFLSKIVVNFKNNLNSETIELFLQSECMYQNFRFKSIPFYDVTKSDGIRRDDIYVDKAIIEGARSLLAKFCNCIQMISFCKCHLERQTFFELLHSISELKVLDIEGCIFAGEDTDCTLKLPKLEKFNFKYPEDRIQRIESGHFYHNLANSNCNLTKLKVQLFIDELFDDTDSDLWEQLEAIAKMVHQNQKTLKSFKIDSFNEHALETLLYRNNELQLEKLVLGEFEIHKDDKIFFNFLAQQKKIKKLDLTIESSLDPCNDLYLKAICENLEHLEQFFYDISNNSDIGLEHLQKLGKLKKLVLTKKRNLTALTEHCFDHIYMPNMKSLGIDYIGLPLPAVQQIPLSFPNLKVLNLSECEAVTDYTMPYLIQLLPSLESLDLSKCENLTERAFFGSARINQLRKLKDLVLDRCDGLTDYSLETFDNPALRSISVAMCHRITNVGWELLCRRCPNLIRLNVSHCCYFDDESARIVVTGLRDLEILDNFQGSSLDEDAFIQAIRSSHIA
ncbi:uncharacterized protein LOC129759894 [Uranotaenia lowii]|uniref:uncharacterized protein LOC129759894 n=1 Tax=Uranotaenia lowii TaxID=190385 RepID=UPI00247A4E20|nr:uncharacterized protein LOC129759894 [Uranotaenia lowii]